MPPKGKWDRELTRGTTTHDRGTMQNFLFKVPWHQVPTAQTSRLLGQCNLVFPTYRKHEQGLRGLASSHTDELWGPDETQKGVKIKRSRFDIGYLKPSHPERV